MSYEIGRRELMGAAGAAVVAGAMGLAASAQAQEAAGKRQVIGISFSPRKGKTTAAAVALALEGAREQDPEIETELIELADFSIPAQLAAGQPLREGEVDDFPALAERIGDPAVVGLIFGSPVYFGTMSALGKAFLDRCGVFRSQGFALRNRAAGVLAVGGVRNGGQELTVREIQVVLSAHDLLVVGTGMPTARIGATLWNQNDSIEEDGFGSDLARALGKRVAEVAAMRG